MKTLIFWILTVALLLPTTAAAQINPAVFGGGATSVLRVNGAKSLSVFGGAKINIKLSPKIFIQTYATVSRVTPKQSSAGSWWSRQIGAVVGYKLASRLSVFAGGAASRNRKKEYLPTFVCGPIVKLTPKVGFVGLVGRNSQTTSASVSIGYTFKPWHR